jgi:endonuclease VIII
MPEGDTIFRTAQALQRHLGGRIVTRFESAFPALTRIDHDRPLAGRTVEGVISRGKHILMRFSGDLVLHTHMRMNGSWHGYPPGAPWRRPARDMRVLVATAEFTAVGFNVPVAELLTSRELSRHEALRELGPDLLDESFDVEGAAQRGRAQGRQTIADVLLNQRVAAGVGNVFKSEILFVAGMYPFTSAPDVSDADLVRILGIARDLLRANTADVRRLAPSRGRRTRDSLDPGAALWVYGRGGKPCRKCGTPIQAKKTGLDARLTYWCPRCQPISAPSPIDRARGV